MRHLRSALESHLLCDTREGSLSTQAHSRQSYGHAEAWRETAANQGSFAALYIFAPKGSLKLEPSAAVTRSSSRPDEEWIRRERQLLEGILWP